MSSCGQEQNHQLKRTPKELSRDKKERLYRSLMPARRACTLPAIAPGPATPRLLSLRAIAVGKRGERLADFLHGPYRSRVEFGRDRRRRIDVRLWRGRIQAHAGRYH